MRFSGASALAVALGTIALVIPSGAAVAASGTDCPPGGGGGAYPGSSCTLAVSDSRVVPGEDVTVSGSGYQSGTEYTITFHSTPQVLATGSVPADGSVTDTVTIPKNADYGRHTLSLIGLDADGGPRDLSSKIVVVPAQAGNSVKGESASAGGSGSGAGSMAGTSTAASGMPNTGADQNLLPLLGAGGGLVIVGAGIAAASRRRRYATHR